MKRPQQERHDLPNGITGYPVDLCHGHKGPRQIAGILTYAQHHYDQQQPHLKQITRKQTQLQQHQRVVRRGAAPFAKHRAPSWTLCRWQLQSLQEGVTASTSRLHPCTREICLREEETMRLTTKRYPAIAPDTEAGEVMVSRAAPNETRGLATYPVQTGGDVLSSGLSERFARLGFIASGWFEDVEVFCNYPCKWQQRQRCTGAMGNPTMTFPEKLETTSCQLPHTDSVSAPASRKRVIMMTPVSGLEGVKVSPVGRLGRTSSEVRTSTR